MKIVLCHNFYRLEGGEDRVFADERALLESYGHDVIQFTKHNDATQDMSRVGLAASTIWNRKTATQLRQIVRRERADVVHFHNTLPLISPSAYYAARRGGAAVVQTLHNYRMMCPKAIFFRDGGICESCLGKSIPTPAILHGCYRDSRAATAAVVGMLTTHRAMKTYRRVVDTYIALSQFSRQKHILGGLPAEKIMVKPNFVSPDPGDGSGNGGFAMYLGRLSPEKGIDTLLAAWSRMESRVPLKIVGDGPLAPQVREAASQHDQIEYLGQKSTDEVTQLIGEAALLVLPSVNFEGFPKTIVEAFSRGTPIVASRLGAMQEFIEDGVTGRHFEPGDADDLAAKVEQLFANRDTLQSMRWPARCEYTEKYTAEQNYHMLMNIYQRALARRGRTVPETEEAAAV